MGAAFFQTFKRLGQAARGYAHHALQIRQLVREQQGMLAETLHHTKSFRWRSEVFRKSSDVSPATAEAIVDAVFYDSEVRRELRKVLEGRSGIQSTTFWDTILRRCQPGVLGFSDAYLDWLTWVHSALPQDGTIIDWNAGDGTVTSALLLGSAGRKLYALDSNPRGAIATKRLLKHCFPQGTDTVTKTVDPENLDFKLPQAQGAVAFNLLFLLGSDQARIDYLTRIGQHLQTDGILVLTEPKPELQKQSVLRLWVSRLAKAASFHHSPMTEFDLALFAEFQRRLFRLEAPIPTTKQWTALANQSGFAVQLVRDALYGQYSVLVLRKLPPAPVRRSNPVIRYHDEPYPS